MCSNRSFIFSVETDIVEKRAAYRWNEFNGRRHNMVRHVLLMLRTEMLEDFLLYHPNIGLSRSHEVEKKKVSIESKLSVS